MAPPPAQAALIPGVEISKESLWESAVKAPELQPAFMEVIRMFEETCERPSAKYQHLSTFFTETATEAALFAAEEGTIERKIDTVLAKLESGIAAIHDSDKFKEFIDTMSKFHNYSLGNIMLITLQRPDAARVAGYSTWQELGRNVRKGEHGIMILAPCFPPRPKKEEEDEEEVEPEPQPTYFKVVHVFDVGQTEGKELPRVEVPVITGEETGPLFQRASTYVAKQGITLDSQPRPDLEPDLMGFWSKPNNLIWVRPDVPQDQRTKTLLHETAHAQCEIRGARDAEVMAESVAYTVANHFGYDTGVRSFPYVAVWAREVKVLKSNLEIIRKVARDMIEGIEHVTELSEVIRMFEKAGDKFSIIKSIVNSEVCFGELEYGAMPTLSRVKELAKLGMNELELLWRELLTKSFERDKIMEQSVYIGLGRKVPAYLQEETAKVAKLFAPMKLLTKEIRDKLPPLYSQENVPDPMVWVKFFTPDSNWTWYGIEFDGEDRFFGWVVGFEKELGYFSLKELESARGPLGLAIERDKWFKPMPLSEVKKLHQHERGGMSEGGTSIRCGQVECYLNSKYNEGDVWAVGECKARGIELRRTGVIESGLFLLHCKAAKRVSPAPGEARGELAQGTMGAIGTAAITGAGIAIGFKFIDWLAKTFSKKGKGELANERSSAGFPLDPRDEKPEDINRFYRWTDTAGQAEVLSELCERADSLGAHLCLAKEGDDIDKKWLEKCPYIGTEEVYSELGRLRFLCWKLTEKLPSSVTILGNGGEMANTEHFCLSGDAWFELQDLISKGEKRKAMEIMWSKGMKLVLAPMTEEGARQVPAYVDVFKTTIAKHYRPTEDFYDGSIRVVKPEEDILVYLGCLKSDDWDVEAERCSPNPTVLKTIVPNSKKYRDELDHLKLVHPEVKINYQTKEVGVEPVVSEAEQEELKAVDEALEKAEVI